MDTQLAKDIIVSTLTHDLLRYVIGAGSVFLALNVAFAGPLRRRKIREETPGWPQIRREILISMRTVLIFAANGIAISFGAVFGVLAIYTDVASHGWLWFWVSTALIIVTHDTWFYWAHWLMHKPRLYRLFHKTHHKSHNPTPFTSYFFDTGEAMVQAVFLPLFVVFIPMHPLALMIFIMHMMARNVLGHCGVEVFPARRDGRPMFDWMTTVTHHDQHHANARYNLGLYFTWWDRLMGTENPNYHASFARCVTRQKTLTGRSTQDTGAAI